VFVAKYSNDLTTNIWAVGFGDASDQLAEGVAVNGAGDVVIGGLFAGVLDLRNVEPFTSAGNVDAFTARPRRATRTVICAGAAGDASVQATSGVAVNRATGEEYYLGNFLSHINWGFTELIASQFSSSTFILKLN